MKRNKETRYSSQNASRQIMCALLALAIVAVVGVVGTYWVLLRNARVMGQKLVESYESDEERNIAIYESMIRLGMVYLQEELDNGITTQEMEGWLQEFFENTSAAVGGDNLRIYAVVDKKVLSAQTGEMIGDYDVNTAAWYRQLMEAEGAVTFTDAYEDKGNQVVTIGAADPGSGDAILIDLLLEGFKEQHKNMPLPDGAGYYLCDSAGNLLYYNIPFDVEEKNVRTYIRAIRGKIVAGELEGSDNNIRDPEGRTRGVFYAVTPNGRLCILTIPYTSLMEGLDAVVSTYALIICLFWIAASVLWLRDRRLRRDIERNGETIRALGNLYYAIYRLDIGNATYEMMKASTFVRSRIPFKGEYQKLLHTLLCIMDKEDAREFAESFSLEHLRELNQKGIERFGGDFQRRFGDESRWINVELLMDKSMGAGEAVLSFRMIEDEKLQQLQYMKLLENALSRADASEKSQKQFFSNMSHDMRTPLNAIIGMANLALREECSAEKRIDYLHKIRMSGRQLLVLINDVLEMSRLEQGSVELRRNSFDICEIMTNCALPFQEQAAYEGKKLRVEMDIQDRMVIGDPFRLTQILNNLVSNAIKFTQTGDSIILMVRQIGQGVAKYLFIVEDSGAGMSEEFVPHLFEPYQREIKFGARDVSGTGLGMPIVKSLVSQMGGQISVESELGRGSRFCVTLPLPSCAGNVQEEKARLTDNVLKGKRILLAEDNELNMEIVTEILRLQGIEVTHAEDGRQAVACFEEAAEFYFDAILMDVQMPEMDGCEAAKKIRSLNRQDADAVPIVALTANAFAEDVARTTEAGMNAHLSKPLDSSLLYATLKRLIDG